MKVIKNLNEAKDSSSLVYGLFNEEQMVKINPEVDEYLSKLMLNDLISSDLGKVTTIHTFDKCQFNKIHIIGLGKRSEYDFDKQAEVFEKVSYKLDRKLTIDVASFAGDLNLEKTAFDLVTAINYNCYAFDQFKSKKQDTSISVNYLISEEYKEVIESAEKISQAIKNTRDLVNLPYNHLNAEKLANYAKELVKRFNSKKVNIKVYNKEEIERLGMNAFLAVNQGSKDEPYLIYIKYNGKDEISEPITLVGKGLTYDTGGYTLKSSMNTMKCDMAGAATVLGVLEAVLSNNLPINLNIVIAATDNRISGEAYLPDDIITAMNKKTIEVVSTDAEGRLTLADALTFAQQEGSKHIIDIATLTGAVVVALGNYTTGVFGNDQEMINRFLEASKKAGESAWQLPITNDIRKQVRSSKVADLTNSTGRNMGASSAAAFLEEFIEDGTKWIHLDIAGTAFDQNKSGGTGVMVKSVYNYLKSLV